MSDWLKLSTAEDFFDNLALLDSRLTDAATIVLAGSAVPILAGCSFRATADIDFAVLPDETVLRVIQSSDTLYRVFDYKAAGVIGLPIDFDERLVEVDAGLCHLNVLRLSLEDWVVSKLASPKLADVLNVPEVTLEMLDRVRGMMPLYGGVSDVQAANDLAWLIAQKTNPKPVEPLPTIKLF